MNTPATPIYTLWQLVLYFLRLGTFGFGGPVALIGYMHRDLVEGKGWISESDYKEGLALSQIAPWPAGGAVGDLSRLCALPGARRHAGRRGVCHPVLPDGAGAGLGLRALRRTDLDAIGVLRRRGGGDRHHRHQRPQAHHQKHRQGQAVVGHFHGAGGRDHHHQIRIGVPVPRRRGAGVGDPLQAALPQRQALRLRRTGYRCSTSP
jgi:hypothetical protein